jgi:pimeloyl-ACP methyl ester carboxylesterase
LLIRALYAWSAASLSGVAANPGGAAHIGVTLVLEVIERKPRRESHKLPVLFVHGAWHGAWCWDEYFLDFFADKGHRALAVSLRGHGKSPAPKSMRFCSIADFVADVATVADGLPERPVIIDRKSVV